MTGPLNIPTPFFHGIYKWIPNDKFMVHRKHSSISTKYEYETIIDSTGEEGIYLYDSSIDSFISYNKKNFLELYEIHEEFVNGEAKLQTFIIFIKKTKPVVAYDFQFYKFDENYTPLYDFRSHNENGLDNHHIESKVATYTIPPDGVVYKYGEGLMDKACATKEIFLKNYRPYTENLNHNFQPDIDMYLRRVRF